MSSEKRSTTGESLMRVHLYYNDAGQLVGQIWNIGGTEYSEGYTYNSADGTLNTMTTAGQTLTMGYDALRRLQSVTTAQYTKVYNYKNLTESTTSQVTALVYNYATNITSFSYGYDGLGNIATYRDADGDLITYTYDALGQLLSATGSQGGSYTYTYDNAGNILTANGHTYTYGNSGWKDLLTAFDGQSITYDISGNPLSYYNGTRWAFTWENGRSLATAADGTTTISYAYDASGLRTSKTVNGVVHNYYYASGKLLRETYGSNVLDFFYDQNGQPFAFKYNGTLYYYITNLQGDVIYVLDGSGAAVASYKYDPYGNIVSATGIMAEINPLRYRGYYFDQDTGLYYLQSRYYDPAIGRFINADALVSTGQGVLGNNMFAYCNNNPVNNYDSGGTSPISYCNGDRNPLFIGYYGCGGGGGGGGSFYCGYGSTKDAKAIVQREKDFLTNTDEQVVLDADYIAFYKGKIIIKAPIGEDAFSFGIIVMGDKVTDVDDVRHEYGHAVHMSQIGVGPYFITAAIPSLIGFWTGDPTDDYYSQPWEYIADYLGGVTRDHGEYNYAPWADSVAKYYWLATLMIGMVP